MELPQALALFTVTSLLSLPALALAAEGPAVNYRWVNAQGDLVVLPVEYHPEWVWQKTPATEKDGPSETPLVRIWIDSLHSEYTFDTPPAGTPPFTPKGTAFPLDFPVHGTTFTQNVSVKKENGTKEELSLVVVPESHHPNFLVHASCEKLGISLKHQEEQPSLVYAAISCEEVGDQVRIYWQHSPELSIENASLPRQASGADWSSYLVSKAELQEQQGEKILGAFRVASQGASIKSDQTVIYAAGSTSLGERRLEVNAGVGFGFLTYSEPNNANTNVAELSLRGGLDARFHLIREILDLSASAYLDILPLVLSSSPSGLSGARAYGVSADAGYWLPFHPAGLRLQAALGWMLWGMWVPGNGYGVTIGAGPEIVLSLFSPQGSKRPYSAHFLYAINSQGFSGISPANFELAAGGRLELTRIKDRFPLAAILELCALSGNTADGLNPHTLLSIFPGLQLGF